MLPVSTSSVLLLATSTLEASVSWLGDVWVGVLPYFMIALILFGCLLVIWRVSIRVVR